MSSWSIHLLILTLNRVLPLHQRLILIWNISQMSSRFWSWSDFAIRFILYSPKSYRIIYTVSTEWVQYFFKQKYRCLISMFRTRKVFHQISNVLSLPVSSSKMEEPFLITTSKRNPPFIWFSVFVGVCKSSSRHSLERQSLWKSKHLTLSKMSKLKFR